MDDSPANSFDDLHVAHPTRRFAASLRGLEINRAWFWTSLGNDAPKFATSIRGEAVSEGNACVFGTTLRSNVFNLTFNSDEEATKLWESIRGTEELVGHDSSDPERLRLRNLQYEVFSKTPPTATLWYDTGWILECELPLAVLTRLSEDLTAYPVERVGLEIEWPFGLVENRSGSWGFFEGSQLRGYVNKLRWSVPMPKLNLSRTPDLTEHSSASSDRTVRSHFFGRKSP